MEPPRFLPSVATQHKIQLILLAPPASGEPMGRGSHFVFLGCARLDPIEKGPATRYSLSWPAPCLLGGGPSDRTRQTQNPLYNRSKSHLRPVQESLVVLIGGIKPQTTRLQGSLGHLNPSTSIRCWGNNGFRSGLGIELGVSWDRSS